MAAYIDLTSTSSSVKAMIYGLDKNYGRTDRTFELYISRTASGSAIDSYSGPIAANVANLGLFTFRGLDPDTKYYVSGVIFYTTGTGASARTDLDAVSIYTESGGGSTPDPGPSEENQIPVITNVTSTWSSTDQGFYVNISAYDNDGTVENYYYSTTASGTKTRFTPGSGGKIFSPGVRRYFYVRDDQRDYSEYYKYTFPEVNPPTVSISINSSSSIVLYNSTNYAYGNVYLIANITQGSASYTSSNVKWYVNNVLQNTGTSYTFDPTSYSGSVEIKVEVTDNNGLSANSTTTIYIAAAPSSLSSLTAYNNGSSASTVSGTTSTDFNSLIYLSTSFSSLSTYQLPITRLDIYIGSREKGSSTSSSSLTYQTLKTSTFTSHPSSTSFANLNLLDDVVPRNYEFFLKATVTDKAGRQATEYFGPYYRIQLPYFSTGDITAAFVSNFVPPILYSKMPSSNLMFEFPFGWAYGKTTSNASPTTLSINCITTFNGTNSTITLKASGANFSNSYFTYESDSTNSCNRMTIAPASLITFLNSQFSDDLTTFDANAYFTFNAQITDAFGNSQSLTLCKDLNQTALSSGYWVNFGAAPVMDSDTTKYTINHSVPSGTSSEVTNQLSSTTWNSYKNMINPNEKLTFVFPAATDQNGNDKISQYNLKIYRSDNLDDFNDFSQLDLNKFQLLKTFMKNESGNFDGLIAQGETSYSYSHIVPNYSISKFVAFAFSAVDNTGLESNTVIVPIKMIICRLQNGTAVINSCDRTSDELYKYTLKFKALDLGGNKFNNPAYSIQTYNNLERSIPVVDGGALLTSIIKYSASFTVQKDSSKTYTINGNITKGYLSLLEEQIINLDFSGEVNVSNPPDSNAKYDLNLSLSYYPYLNYSDPSKSINLLTSPVTVYTTNEPTLSIRKNHLGINSQDLSDEDLLKIIALSQGRSLITLKYELNELIFNLGQALVQNIILSDESD